MCPGECIYSVNYIRYLPSKLAVMIVFHHLKLQAINRRLSICTSDTMLWLDEQDDRVMFVDFILDITGIQHAGHAGLSEVP